ncbi:MAG: GIY-YIG nuclease family protein [Balneolales bacterium]|nr:GIY-YIG nuclease family protein [Balneolales bacterium]
MPVPREQFSLIEVENPLVEKTGLEFWDSLPEIPGVYYFRGANDHVLYVGKAGNLRKRLFSYKNASRKTASSKIIRLIRNTAYISWDECETEYEALLLENAQIRHFQPEFNSANKAFKTYYFIHLESNERQNEIRLTIRMSEPASKNDELRNEVFGAFKGHQFVRSSLGALHRTLFLYSDAITLQRNSAAPQAKYDASFPGRLMNVLTPRTFAHSFEFGFSRILSIVGAYLSGESNELIHLRKLAAEHRSCSGGFAENFEDYDIGLLSRFYSERAVFNRVMSGVVPGLGKRQAPVFLPQNQLDDAILDRSFRLV